MRILDCTGYTGDKSQWAALRKASSCFGLSVNSTPTEIKVVTDAGIAAGVQLYAMDDEVNSISPLVIGETVASANCAKLNRVIAQIKANTGKTTGSFGFAFSPPAAAIGSIVNSAAGGAWVNFIRANQFAAQRVRVDASMPQWYYQEDPSPANNIAFFTYMQMSFVTSVGAQGCKPVTGWFMIEISEGGGGTPGDFLPLTSVQTIVEGAAALGVEQLVLFAGNSKAFSSVPSNVRAYIATFP